MPADTVRFFARLHSLSLECPRCGKIYTCSEKSRKPFDRRTGVFRCLQCSLTLALGVIAYRVTNAPYPRPAEDAVPTPAQALALRTALSGGQLSTGPRKTWSDPRNIMPPADCRCEVHGRGLIIHPGCPIHSVTTPLGVSDPDKSTE